MSDDGWNKARDGNWTEIPNGYSPLSPNWSSYLSTQDETGPGYHVVTVTLVDGNKVRATVIDCTLIDTLLDANMIKEIKVEGA